MTPVDPQKLQAAISLLKLLELGDEIRFCDLDAIKVVYAALTEAQHELASDAYKEASKIHHGEYARI